MSKKKGIFITFEGGEGTGKSTQIKMLCGVLADQGVSVIATREPGGTDQAERIRDVLVQGSSGHFDPLTEVLLLSASRREHIVNKIRPALEQGKWVISDRFVDSTRAMQGSGMGVDPSVIEDIYKIIADDLSPDLTFMLDIDPEEGLKRSAKQLTVTDNTKEAGEDRYERMSLAFHERLRQGFLDIAKRESKRCVVIDAAQDIQGIHNQILDIVSQRFDIEVKKVSHG